MFVLAHKSIILCVNRFVLSFNKISFNQVFCELSNEARIINKRYRFP